MFYGEYSCNLFVGRRVSTGHSDRKETFKKCSNSHHIMWTNKKRILHAVHPEHVTAEKLATEAKIHCHISNNDVKFYHCKEYPKATKFDIISF